MKKNLLSLAVAAGVAGITATAQGSMYLNPEKTGEVLLFPFYNAENGNTTTIHIVNTTARAKAVKVRIMEFVNSQEVLDFNLYLSAEDHFAFGIVGDPNGDGAALITSDNSCTVPALGTANGAYPGTQNTLDDGTIVRTQPFVPYAYAADTGWNTVDRTLMGHVEIIEMGDLFDDPAGTHDPAAWATHDAAGVPANCAALDTAWATGVWSAGLANEGVTAPTGGLYGISSLLNVADAAAYGIEPAAIDDWATTNAAGIDALHTSPGTLRPSMNIGGRTTSTVYHGLGFGGNTEELVSGRPADAVSTLFMTSVIENDVMINDAIGGQTDWVITFPTRRYYVDGVLTPVRPFTDLYSGTATAPELSSCEDILVTQWDREEANVTPRNSFSPRPPGAQGDEICWETNVISARADATAMNTFAASLPFQYAEGWQRIAFSGTQALALHQLVPLDAATLDERPMNGLPAMGFAAYKYVNGTVVDGALNNYGFVSDHKTNTVISVPAP